MAEKSPSPRLMASLSPAGQAAVENVFARLPQRIDGFTIDVRRLVGSDDTLLAENRHNGTDKSTVCRLTFSAHVSALRKGEVVRFQRYVDIYAHRKRSLHGSRAAVLEPGANDVIHLFRGGRLRGR